MSSDLVAGVSVERKFAYDRASQIGQLLRLDDGPKRGSSIVDMKAAGSQLTVRNNPANVCSPWVVTVTEYRELSERASVRAAQSPN